MLQDLTLAKAMVASSDGRYLFVASVSALSVLDASKKKILHTHEDDRLDVHSMTCTILDAEVYLLIGIDELGIAIIITCC